jgi:uncharacterized repeat protein (TIGR01451 family)
MLAPLNTTSVADSSSPIPRFTYAGVHPLWGHERTTKAGTAFAPLSVKVTDALGNPVIGATVTFTVTPAANGASGSFAGGANTAVTDAHGVATASTFTANTIIGPYQMTASTAAATGTLYMSNTAALSGRITVSGTGLAGATVTLSGANGGSRTTDSGGNYLFPILTGSGNTTVTPSKQNCTFTPPSLTVTMTPDVTADFTAVCAVPLLSVTSTHTGNFTQGQLGATYTVTVSNAASAAATFGQVTVTETIPSHMALVSMAGAGWTCPPGGFTCWRTDVLAAGASYPAITVLVNVALNATSPQVNAVRVSGGGSGDAATTDTTVIIAVGRRTAVGVYRAGGWYLDMNGNTQWDGLGIDRIGYFGFPGDTIVVGDWDGSGVTKVGVFRNGTWYLDMNGNGQWDGPGVDREGWFGQAGDTPVVGDWTGSGTTKVGVFRGGQWHLDLSGTAQWSAATVRVGSFGFPGDLPVVGDWNGSGTTKIGVFRNGQWHLDLSGTAQWGPATVLVGSFGIAGDIPVVGDWDSSGRTKVGIFRNGQWHLDLSGTAQWAAVTDRAGAFGLPGDIPVVGDWDGSGTAKVGVFRNGGWYLDMNGNAQWDGVAVERMGFFGFPGDVPVVGRWN